MNIPTVWSYLSVNLLLQAFDGVLTYRVLSLGIPEANPLVSASIAMQFPGGSYENSAQDSARLGRARAAGRLVGLFVV